MVIQLTLPNKDSNNVKDLVFSILTEEYPLKLIELTNFIRKRYGKSVTFQGVRKAILQLMQEGVVIKDENEFSINHQWVQESKAFLDKLYLRLIEEKSTPKNKKIDSIGGEVSVLTFGSVNEMMRAWEDLSDVWFKNFKKGEYNVNCYQAAHSWEILLHPDIEAKLMGQAKQKGIRSYILCTENMPLDRSIVRFHDKIGVKMVIVPSSSNFDKSHYIGTYGDLIIQAKYPPEIVKKLDLFFKKNKTIEDLDLAELSKIVNTTIPIKMTVIRNLEMAKQINVSILSQID
ncbi:MAG: hypothetical protein V2A62_02585 [Candidatus Woesearchaeota archaeon]